MILDDTIRAMEAAAAAHDAVAVGYSDGKDSRVVLDLCKRFFKRVAPFYMQVFPGMPLEERMIDAAERRIGLPILRTPHWVLVKLIRGAIYCDPSYRNESIPEYLIDDVFALVMVETNTRLVVIGEKSADGQRRRINLCLREFIMRPLFLWKKYDVLAYLKMRNIPLPTNIGGNNISSGLDLSDGTILWLYDNSREDYNFVLRRFPYIEAVVKRREFYG
jgi:hypothetical protein